jgi:hypothetical protein
MVDLMRETGGIIEHINSVKLMHGAIADHPAALPNSDWSVAKSAPAKRPKTRTHKSKPTAKKMPAD